MSSRVSRTKEAAAAIGAAIAVSAGLVTAYQLTRGGASPPLHTGSVSPTTHPTSPGPSFEFDAVDTAIADLRRANVAFNAPTELHLGKQAEIRLLLSLRQSIAQLKKKIIRLGREEGARIRISDIMVADLSGLGFTIEKIGPATQVVDPEGITEWRWNVEPTKAGTRRLHLTLSALITVNGSQGPYTVRTFERSWNVRVPWPERITGFVKDHWQFLWTFLLLPIVGFLWRRRSRSEGDRRAGGTPSPPSPSPNENGSKEDGRKEKAKSHESEV